VVATGNTRSTMGTRPEAENTMMKATSWSSITRSEPMTPPSIAAAGCRSAAWSGSERGASASEIPDILPGGINGNEPDRGAMIALVDGSDQEEESRSIWRWAAAAGPLLIICTTCVDRGRRGGVWLRWVGRRGQVQTSRRMRRATNAGGLTRRGRPDSSVARKGKTLAAL
jgi:hypothetical protein